MLTLGIIGLGRWGTNIMNTLEAFPDCQVKYKRTTDYADLLKKDDLDGILIATPGSTHAKIALPFIKKGLPVFIEKPMTTSKKDALKLVRAAEKSKSKIFVGHIHLYNPAWIKAKELIKQSGPIRLMYFEGTNNGPFRDDMSALWDWAPHDVYLALDLMKNMPIRVQAWGVNTLRPKTNLHDFTVIKMTFPNNIEAISLTSWLLPIKQKKATIVAKKNTIIFDEAQAKKVKVYAGLGPTVRGLTVEKHEPIITEPDYDPTLPLIVELTAFLNMIKKNKKPLTDLAQGLRVVSILSAAEKSLSLDGQKVKL